VANTGASSDARAASGSTGGATPAIAAPGGDNRRNRWSMLAMAAERIADSHWGATGPIVLILETPPAATVAGAPMPKSSIDVPYGLPSLDSGLYWVPGVMGHSVDGPHGSSHTRGPGSASCDRNACFADRLRRRHGAKTQAVSEAPIHRPHHS
jgi:hypothetical protein